MLEAGLEFEDSADRVVMAFAELPLSLRPTHFSHEETVGSDTDRIEDRKRLTPFVAKRKSGFFLLGPGLTYSIRVASGRPLVCDCFFDVSPELAKQFLEHMSRARPSFGFASAPGERERRNRIAIQQGANAIESWVGRDTQKYVPGFYWLTLLSSAFAKQHGIAISAVKAVAEEHTELEGRQHLFRFYERPEDWQKTSSVTELCASLSGVFDIEKIKPQLSAAKTFLELNSMLRDWK